MDGESLQLAIVAVSLVAGLWALRRAFRRTTPSGAALRVPRPPVAEGPHWAVALGLALLFLMVLGINFARPSDGAAGDPLTNLIAGGVQLAVIAALAFATTRPVRSLGFPGDGSVSAWRVGAVCGLAALPPTFAVIGIRMAAGFAEAEHPMLTEMRERPSATAILAVVVTAVVLAPLAEEIAFRGLIQNCLARRIKPEVAIVLTSMLFLGVHPVDTIPALTPLTLGLGYVYHQTQSLPAVMVMHAVFNAVMVLLTLAASV